MLALKAWSNDRNISTQHLATLLGTTYCVRSATLLRYVACVWPVHSTLVATSCNNVARCCVEMLRAFGQAFRSMLAAYVSTREKSGKALSLFHHLKQAKNFNASLARVVVFPSISKIFVVPNSKFIFSSYSLGRGQGVEQQLGGVYVAVGKGIGDIFVILWKYYFVIRVSDKCT